MFYLNVVGCNVLFRSPAGTRAYAFYLNVVGCKERLDKATLTLYKLFYLNVVGCKGERAEMVQGRR